MPPNLLVEGRDITKRKSVEDKLHLAAAVFEQAREGFVIADREGRVVSVNQAFCEISGYDMDELQGQRTAASVLTGETPIGFAGGNPVISTQASGGDLVAATGTRRLGDT